MPGSLPRSPDALGESRASSPDRPDTRGGSVDLDAIGVGFSRKAIAYDARLRTHPVDIWARGQIRRLVVDALRPGAAILEINAGTGADAAYLAALGFRVHATDIAAGMVAAIRQKIEATRSPESFTAEIRAYSQLAGVPGAPYDLVLSNFGGLNCTDSLGPVARGIAGVLRSGGLAVLVVMPPLCPWEHVQILRGHRATATRRWRRGGVLANIEGVGVRTWYHPAGRVAAAFGPDFRVREIRSLCLFAPALLLERFPLRHPRLTRLGMRLDERLGGLWPFRAMGDFCVITLEYRPRRPPR